MRSSQVRNWSGDVEKRALIGADHHVAFLHGSAASRTRRTVICYTARTTDLSLQVPAITVAVRLVH